MKVTYRHQFPTMQYGVAEFTLEDDVPEGEVDAAMEAMLQHCQRLYPWPARGAPAPHNDPAQAEPRPSAAQMKRLRELASKLAKETGEPANLAPPTTAAEAEKEIQDLEAAIKALGTGGVTQGYPAGTEIPAKLRRCSGPHKPPVPISVKVWDYSIEKHGKPLCFQCQEKARVKA